MNFAQFRLISMFMSFDHRVGLHALVQGKKASKGNVYNNANSNVALIQSMQTQCAQVDWIWLDFNFPVDMHGGERKTAGIHGSVIYILFIPNLFCVFF